VEAMNLEFDGKKPVLSHRSTAMIERLFDMHAPEYLESTVRAQSTGYAQNPQMAT
jgi:hypothetical protein